jgi:hypothetical protein
MHTNYIGMYTVHTSFLQRAKREKMLHSKHVHYAYIPQNNRKRETKCTQKGNKMHTKGKQNAHKREAKCTQKGNKMHTKGKQNAHKREAKCTLSMDIVHTSLKQQKGKKMLTTT